MTKRKAKYRFLKPFLILLFSFFCCSENVFSIKDTINTKDSSNTLSFMACGDINLGRKIGQKLLKGDLEFPFTNVKDSFKLIDVVFANLESQLSDQNGETQNPRHNLIFTGPSEGAACLKKNGITIVSTANNHAFDYGEDAFEETIMNLKKQKVSFCGTSIDKDSCYLPAILEKNGFKIAFFAVTDFVNIWKKKYQGLIAFPDTSKLFPQIRKIRPFVDLIIVSYHGGSEYVDKPLKKTVDFSHQVIDEGADLFLGHHPHVFQGIEYYKKKLIFFSLGNFVFYQPQKYWTQRTFAVKFIFSKNDQVVTMKKLEILPASAGLQPAFYDKGADYNEVISRLKKLSPTIQQVF